jgi:hypothetical protein
MANLALGAGVGWRGTVRRLFSTPAEFSKNICKKL